MSTGLETWNQNLLDIGALYPMPGSEVLLALIGLGTWIVWHVVQIIAENKVYEEDEKKLFASPDRLKKAMEASAAGTLMEEMKVHGENLKR
jgi:hypothetical protein